MIGWVVARMAVTWAVKVGDMDPGTRKDLVCKDLPSQRLGALGVNLLSMGFAMIGGLICAQYFSL